jgi:hypothetical protein
MVTIKGGWEKIILKALQKGFRNHPAPFCGYAVLFFSACSRIFISGQALQTGIENNVLRIYEVRQTINFKL